MAQARVHIGCAGWAIPKSSADAFPHEGSHLHRYARRLNAVEINSSFYRPHRRTTYERWAASVPDEFRFSVKIPKDITHKARLAGSSERLSAFLDEIAGLGDKLGPLLLQLPPSLVLDRPVASAFFDDVRRQFSGTIVCEPRHATWFGRSAAVLRKFDIGRVGADPAPIPAAAKPATYAGVCYYRLHGSPRVYYSSYPSKQLTALAARIRKDMARGDDVWYIFDNTAEGAAQANALTLQALLENA